MTRDPQARWPPRRRRLRRRTIAPGPGSSALAAGSRSARRRSGRLKESARRLREERGALSRWTAAPPSRSPAPHSRRWRHSRAAGRRTLPRSPRRTLLPPRRAPTRRACCCSRSTRRAPTRSTASARKPPTPRRGSTPSPPRGSASRRRARPRRCRCRRTPAFHRTLAVSSIGVRDNTPFAGASPHAPRDVRIEAGLRRLPRAAVDRPERLPPPGRAHRRAGDRRVPAPPRHEGARAAVLPLGALLRPALPLRAAGAVPDALPVTRRDGPEGARALRRRGRVHGPGDRAAARSGARAHGRAAARDPRGRRPRRGARRPRRGLPRDAALRPDRPRAGLLAGGPRGVVVGSRSPRSTWRRRCSSRRRQDPRRKELAGVAVWARMAADGKRRKAAAVTTGALRLLRLRLVAALAVQVDRHL